jgi:hypothetical protein
MAVLSGTVTSINRPSIAFVAQSRVAPRTVHEVENVRVLRNCAALMAKIATIEAFRVATIETPPPIGFKLKPSGGDAMKEVMIG